MVCFRNFLLPRCSQCSRGAARCCTRFLSLARLCYVLRDFAGLLTGPGPRGPCSLGRLLSRGARSLRPCGPCGSFSARCCQWRGGLWIAVHGIAVSS